jgi:hypothetical protein
LEDEKVFTGLGGFKTAATDGGHSPVSRAVSVNGLVFEGCAAFELESGVALEGVARAINDAGELVAAVAVEVVLGGF